MTGHPAWTERLQVSVRGAFRLDPTITFLNHGSFGAVPVAVEEECGRWRSRLEARPIEMLGRNIYGLLSGVKTRLGEYLGTAPERIGLVTNATSGVGAVLRSLEWHRGDRITLTNHGYNAVRQAAHAVAERFGVEVDIADLPLPIGDATSVVEGIMGSVTQRTKLVIVDHVTSPTALVLPVAQIVRACHERGVRCLVDGAHAPGMLPLNIDAIAADWYTGNLHKWVCAPKGSAILVPSQEVAPWTHPETTSHFHGHGFAAEFDWQGTRDYSGWLSLPVAVDFVESAGHQQLMRRNHDLARWAHEVICHRLGTTPISPLDGSALGSMAAIELPAAARSSHPSAAHLQAALYEESKIEVPIIDWGGKWLVRVSAQAYNKPGDYLALLDALSAAAS